MSHCLSSSSIFHSISNQKAIFKPNPASYHPRIPNLLSVKAMAAESRDNLDHLQRTNMVQNQQPRTNMVQNQQPRTNMVQNQQPRRRSGPVAPIGLWDRFPTARTVQQMMDTMDRIMEDPFSYIPTENNGSYVRGRTPWEIKEAESEYKMRFDMPGMTKEDVKVWVEEKMLVLKAEKLQKKTEEENGEEDWSAKTYGRYSCRIALPENVEFEKIKAEVKDGVLYITIPKSSPSAKILDINVQ